MNLLPLLQQILGSAVLAATAEPIKASTTPARVYRVTLEGKPGSALPNTLILKTIQPDWPDDPHGPDREVNFYTHLASHRGPPYPTALFTGCDPESQTRFALLTDLQNWRFPDRTHAWTMAEARCFIPAYARLHSREVFQTLANPYWLFPRHEEALNPDQTSNQVAALVMKGVWEPIPNLEKLVAWTTALAPEMRRLPEALLHNDVFPPNIGLPCDPSADAVLLDWEMAGRGLPELDLAFLFLQPFKSARHLDRAALLEAYWQARAQLGDPIPSREDRRTRQRYADALWALWLIPVAYRRMTDPFPPDSSPARYWESFFPVLHAWLCDLCALFG